MIWVNFWKSYHPQQRISSSWYQGTADAIYQNIYTIEHDKPDLILILSGDHIYKMDYRKMIRYHMDSGADLTVAGIEIDASDSVHFGIIGMDENNCMTGFQEKPKKTSLYSW